MSRRARSPSPHDGSDRPLKQLKITVFSSQKELDPGSATQAETASSATTPRAPLKSLLDLSEVENEQLQARFDAIAESLIHHSRLQVINGSKTAKYQILEAEFYLRDSVRHWDPFTHGEEEQRVSGRWYFHRVPRWGEPKTPPTQLTGYRGGTRKGLDLTVGGPLEPPSSSSDATGDVRGGILLRTIKNEADGKVTCGPSLLVDELLRAAGSSDITHLVQTKMQNDRAAFAATSESPSTSDAPGSQLTLSIVPYETKKTAKSPLPTIYTSPRIGLDLSNAANSEHRIQFVDRPYRYFILPQTFAKKGATQTFTGLYRHLKASGGGASASKIGGLIGMDVSKFLGHYNAGYGSGDVKGFVGPSAKGTSSVPDKYLRMLGALEKRREEPDLGWEYRGAPEKNVLPKKSR
ncbi:hypothetical protein FRB90_003107 [Tulasnella sp. 427]|nr:hypothetical protein FRB90_003107 [Tulasnella sp. 427]